MPRPLTFTPRQQKVYKFICAFKEDHDGIAPTISEIGNGCGIKSTSTVKYYLDCLVRHGMILCDYGVGKSRMISVVGGRWIPPSRGVSLPSPVNQGARAPSFSSTKS